MRLLIIMSALLFLSSACAQPVSVLDGSVRFQPPDGFQPMTPAQVSAKFPSVNAPAVAYANAAGNVSISITHPAAAVAPAQIEALKSNLEGGLAQGVPGLEWRTREIIEVEGRRWVHLEFTSAAVDTGIHNHLYATSHQGRMLGFNFNSTIAEYPAHADALAESFRSIRIDD